MLYVPYSGFNASQSSTTARPVAAYGTAVTPSSGAKGSWTQVIASLDADTYGLLIAFSNNAVSAASRNGVADIGIGPASSEQVLIPDLIWGNCSSYIAAGGPVWYYFPVFIAAGTRVSCRSAGVGISPGTHSVYIRAMQQPTNPTVVSTLGYVEAVGMSGFQGTALTPGTTNKSAWVSLGTTARGCWWWQLGAQVSNADATHNAAAIHIDLAEGDGSTYNILIQDALMLTTTAEQTSLPTHEPMSGRMVPAGATLYMRAQSSGTADPLFVTAYGGA